MFSDIWKIILKINNPAAATSSLSKVVLISRDLTAATGAVATTGIGFLPRRLDVIAALPGNLAKSTGYADNTPFKMEISEDYLGAVTVANDNIATLATAVGANQTVTGVTYDADGFTLTWAKTGSPTGTAYLVGIASR